MTKYEHHCQRLRDMGWLTPAEQWPLIALWESVRISIAVTGFRGDWRFSPDPLDIYFPAAQIIDHDGTFHARVSKQRPRSLRFSINWGVLNNPQAVIAKNIV